VKRKQKFKRVDRQRTSLKIGDLIQVMGIPPDVERYGDDEELETKKVFQRCLGQRFPIHAFDEDRVELLVGEVMGRPAYEHSIYLEPQYVEFVSHKPERESATSAKTTKRRRVVK
jgi:hypothetical protein